MICVEGSPEPCLHVNVLHLLVIDLQRGEQPIGLLTTRPQNSTVDAIANCGLVYTIDS